MAWGLRWLADLPSPNSRDAFLGAAAALLLHAPTQSPSALQYWGSSSLWPTFPAVSETEGVKTWGVAGGGAQNPRSKCLLCTPWPLDQRTVICEHLSGGWTARGLVIIRTGQVMLVSMCFNHYRAQHLRCSMPCEGRAEPTS